MLSKLTVNVPTDLRSQAHALAALRGETVSDVVRAALEAYVEGSLSLDVLRAMEGHELQEEDAFLRLIAIAEGGPTDLSSDKHAYAVE